MKWSCEGNPDYTMEEIEKADRGTDIVLYIDEENENFLEEGKIIDVGAFSTGPGSADVSEEEELLRMRNGLAIVRREQPDALVSIDTFRPSVARMAVEEFGADIINDISEGRGYYNNTSN